MLTSLMKVKEKIRRWSEV